MPRKSTASSPADAEPDAVTATEQQLRARAEQGVSIEDYLLPRTLTLRLAKSALPPNTSIQKDALLAIQKAATVFVSYLSSHANEATLKRTVAPSDVLAALSELEFDAFRAKLELELEAHVQAAAARRSSKKAPAAEQDVLDRVGRGVKRVKRDDDAALTRPAAAPDAGAPRLGAAVTHTHGRAQGQDDANESTDELESETGEDEDEGEGEGEGDDDDDDDDDDEGDDDDEEGDDKGDDEDDDKGDDEDDDEREGESEDEDDSDASQLDIGLG